MITSRFYAPQLVPPGTAEARISYGISVRLAVCLSRPGTDSMPGEIDSGSSPYDSLEYLVRPPGTVVPGGLMFCCGFFVALCGAISPRWLGRSP